MEITHRSTKKRGDSSEDYLYYREESDINNLLAFIMKTSGPFQIGGSGISSMMTVDAVAEEFKFIQKFYRKTDGLRIRHEYLKVFKTELTAGAEVNQIINLAIMMSKYYFYKGFQNVWGIVDRGDSFSISYAINTVSPFDGSKYHYNKKDILADEYAYLGTIWQSIVSGGVYAGYDMRILEFYPYSFNSIDITDTEACET